MSDLIKIAVDAMGGDGSPKKIIDGIILNQMEYYTIGQWMTMSDNGWNYR